MIGPVEDICRDCYHHCDRHHENGCQHDGCTCEGWVEYTLAEQWADILWDEQESGHR